ncbi:hypothetical protein B0I35DRAFT_238375 [Stachybotrys elegans]|uniref:Zn(2)-C6 fungal-type domain-containing protein n=1 Tax=Stachybotrys elegans TaxID=80388 RepID=A0A8K0WRP7_9HYPO|nr:hypothetical protein B0I35DRAFT_238375 [Stachybotrys elegans]
MSSDPSSTGSFRPPVLRPLQAAPIPEKRSLASAHQPQHGPISPIETLPARRRQPAVAACLPCRRRKSRCSAERPKCQTCILRRSSCEYDGEPSETPAQTAKRKITEFQDIMDPRHRTAWEILKLVGAWPERQGDEALLRLKLGVSPPAVLDYLLNEYRLVHLALRPDPQICFEFPYEKSIPEYLCVGQNKYLVSNIYNYCVQQSRRASSSSLPAEEVRSQPVDAHMSPYARPYYLATICDPRLEQIQPSKWTSVSGDDQVMRSMLVRYFQYDYQWSPTFQKDHFLDDMLAGRTRFCSSLLVNAILAFASHTYTRASDRAEFWQPHNITYRFLAEAKRLWELAAAAPKLTTIQAGPILTLTYVLCGVDQLGLHYTKQAISMARARGLFDASSRPRGGRRQPARDFTAWALFTIQSQLSWVLYEGPLMPEPPQVPLPDPLQDEGWYGDFRVKYELDPIPYASHFPHLFRSHAKLSIILNAVAWRCFPGQGRRTEYSTKLALEAFRSLVDWYDQLPNSLKPVTVSFPSHLKLHMMYWEAVIRILTPVGNPGSPHDAAEWDLETSAMESVFEAVTSLEMVIRLYYLRHGFAMLDSFLSHALTTLASIRLNHLNSVKDKRDMDPLLSTVILAGYGLENQGQSSFVAQRLLQILRGALHSTHGSIFDKHVEFNYTKLGTMDPNMVRSSRPVNLVNVAEDPDPQRLSVILARIEGLETDDSSNNSDVEEESPAGSTAS